nr:SdpI family protein [Herbihabitans rhizosphaerae]
MIVLTALLVLLGAAVAVVGYLGLAERLPRNRFSGVRTEATMRDDDAFRVGNKVAGAPILAGGLVAVAGGAIAWVMPSTAGAIVSMLLGAVGMVVIAVAGGIVGHRAAAATPKAMPAGCKGCACGGGGCAVLQA